jgi:hypothetical protein
MGRRTVVLGGYGAVGREVVRLLANADRQVLVAGRDESRASAVATSFAGAAPASVDVSRPDSLHNVVARDDLVINCTGLENVALARSAVEAEAHYVDISASQDYLAALAALDQTAIAHGRTILCSVGLAPGLTNLLAADLHRRYPGVQPIDVTCLLGLGDEYGDASRAWTLARIGTTFPDPVDGRPVGNFSDGRRVLLPAGFGRRRAYRFDLADQHILTCDLQRPVVTRLCFDPAIVTRFVAAASRLPALAGPIAQVVRRLPATRVGTAWFAARVELRGGPMHWAIGSSQSQGTAAVAAFAARLFDIGEPEPGFHHLHNLTTLAEAHGSLHDADVHATTRPLGGV